MFVILIFALFILACFAKKAHDLRKFHLRKMNSLFMTDLKNIIIRNGGLLYGGAVRDNILSRAEGTLFEPRDFDVNFKNSESIDNFKNDCVSRGYTVAEVDTRMMNNRGGSNICHYKFQVRNGKFSVYVEICKIVSEPPYGPCDFTCNILVENSGGVRLSNSVGKEVYGTDKPTVTDKNRIVKAAIEMIESKVFYRIRRIEDLKRNEVAVISRRVNKMEKRGWKVMTMSWGEKNGF